MDVTFSNEGGGGLLFVFASKSPDCPLVPGFQATSFRENIIAAPGKVNYNYLLTMVD